MKHEIKGQIILEFIGLRSKMYATKLLDSDSFVKKIKSIKESAINSLQFDDFYQCLFNQTQKTAEQNLIRSKKHEVFTMK